MDLKKCQIFTPQHIVKYMLDLVLDDNLIFGKSFIDNSCGEGAFLEEIAERYISVLKKKKYSKDEIRKQLELNIVGCDIDEQCVNKCVEKLNRAALKHNIKSVNWNITVTDGLFIEENKKYDYVVGNPPYIAYKDLDVKNREVLKENFDTCAFGKCDYSYAFIEKGLKLLNQNGKMVYITPSNMFKTTFGERLRNHMKKYLTHIVNFPISQIFQGVLTSPAITVFSKGQYSNIISYKEIIDSNNISEKIIDKDRLNGKWDFKSNYDNGERRFGDFFKASNCIATLANNIFVHNVDKNGNLEVNLEPEILRPAVSPKSLHYGIKQKIIFPYYYKNKNVYKYSIEEMNSKFPKTINFLNKNKDKLEARDSDKNAQFYEYGRSQAIAHINQRKLMFSPIVTREVKVYELDKDTIPYSGVYIIKKGDLSLETAKIILETKNFYKYVESKGINVNGASLRISTKDIEEYRF